MAEGINSRVYKYRDFALKSYSLRHTGEYKLLFYQEVTSNAAALVKNEDWMIKLPPPFGVKHIEVNPFIKLRHCDKCGDMENVSLFIPGLRLDSVFYSLVSEDIQFSLLNLSNRFNSRLGVRGIDVSGINVKSVGISKIIITDLGYDINDLRKV